MSSFSIVFNCVYISSFDVGFFCAGKRIGACRCRPCAGSCFDSIKLYTWIRLAHSHPRLVITYNSSCPIRRKNEARNRHLDGAAYMSRKRKGRVSLRVPKTLLFFYLSLSPQQLPFSFPLSASLHWIDNVLISVFKKKVKKKENTLLRFFCSICY